MNRRRPGGSLCRRPPVVTATRAAALRAAPVVVGRVAEHGRRTAGGSMTSSRQSRSGFDRQTYAWPGASSCQVVTEGGDLRPIQRAHDLPVAELAERARDHDGCREQQPARAQRAEDLVVRTGTGGQVAIIEARGGQEGSRRRTVPSMSERASRCPAPMANTQCEQATSCRADPPVVAQVLRWPQSRSAFITGPKLRPLSVRWYSRRGGCSL